MALLNMFKRKREVELPLPQYPAPGPASRTELPSDLERLRMSEPLPYRSEPSPYQPPSAPMFAPPPEPTFRPTPSPPPAHTPEAKIDLILSKLETIDARLRVLEEKLERKLGTSTTGSSGAFSSMF